MRSYKSYIIIVEIQYEVDHDKLENTGPSFVLDISELIAIVLAI